MTTKVNPAAATPEPVENLCANLAKWFGCVRKRIGAVIPSSQQEEESQQMTMDGGPQLDFVKPYSFTEPFPVDSFAASASLFDDLINTRAFRRLANVRFLGGIDYVFVRSPNGTLRNVRYTRHQHSLGVARLSLQYTRRKGITNGDARHLFVAALLHDIGHAPFSHSLEPVFFERFGLSHHIASEKIICGKVEIGVELHRVLLEHAIDVDRILALISGVDQSFDEFFSGPINFDTIEGISRSKLYGGHNPSTLNPSSILDAAILRRGETDRELVDGFWNHKNEAYKYIVCSRAGILADYACQYYMRRNLAKITEEDFYTPEENMFRKMQGLKQLLVSPTFERDMLSVVDAPISYSARTFYVDGKYDFYSHCDRDRYRQVKQSALLDITGAASEPVEVSRDLFDDERLRSSEGVF